MRLVAIAVVTLALAPAAAVAAPGDLDPAFGEGGSVFFPEWDGLSDVVPVADGIFDLRTNCGMSCPRSWLVEKRDLAGEPDEHFGVNGEAAGTTQAAPPNLAGLDLPASALVDDAGRLVVIGEWGHKKLAVVRYLPNGEFDASFGGDGISTLRVPGASTAHGQAVVPSGTGGYVIAGGGFASIEGRRGAYRYWTVLARLGKDGTQDESFGEDGFVSLRPARGLERDSEGRFLLAAQKRLGRDRRVTLVYRLNQNGTRDRSFGVRGVVALDLGLSTFPRDLVLAGEKPVVATHVRSYPRRDPSTRAPRDRAVLVRLRRSGTFDRRFGKQGRVRIPDFEGWNTDVQSLEVDEEGRIAAGGYSAPGAQRTNPMVLRLHPEGSMDRSFGRGGPAFFFGTRSGSGGVDQITVRVAESGALYVGGSTSDGHHDGLPFLSRLLG